MEKSEVFKTNFAYIVVSYTIIMICLLISLAILGFLTDGTLLGCCIMICSYPTLISWQNISEYLSISKKTNPLTVSGEVQKIFVFMAYTIISLMFFFTFFIIVKHNVVSPMSSDIKFVTSLISIQTAFGTFYQYFAKEIFIKL